MKRILFLIPLIAFLIAEMFIVKASADLNEGLIAYYPFNGTANDESGYGNHGVVYGAALIEDRCGNPNNAYHFDGIDDYIDAGNPELENFSENFSLIAWINPQKGIHKWPTIIGKWNHSYHDTFFFGLDELSTGLCGEVTTTTGNYWKNSVIDLLNTWHNVAMTYDNPNTRMELYVDGNVIGTFYDFGYGNLVNNEDNDILIGGLFHHAYFYGFKGIIDDVRIYNRILSVYEIRELFHGDITLIIPETATEGGGILNNQGLISVFPALNMDLAINLSSDDTSLVAVPETVTIYADQNSATFDIEILHNCIVNGSQTATITASACGYVSGSDTIQVTDSDVSVEMNLPPGWSMISLPVKPCNCSVSSLFPGTKTIYGYEKGTGYVQVNGDEDLEVGDGYWILLDQNQNFTFTGQPIRSYHKTIYEDEWEMVGGCTYSARASADGCNIGVIYGYAPGAGYQRVLQAEDIEPCEGYWILLSKVMDQASLDVESIVAGMHNDFSELLCLLGSPAVVSIDMPNLQVESLYIEHIDPYSPKLLTGGAFNPQIEYLNPDLLTQQQKTVIIDFGSKMKKRIAQTRLIDKNNNELLFPENTIIRKNYYSEYIDEISPSDYTNLPFDYYDSRITHAGRTLIRPSMWLRSNQQITLKEGLYFFESLTLGEGSILNTKGKVQIYLTSLELEKEAQMTGGSIDTPKPNDLIIIAEFWVGYPFNSSLNKITIGPAAKIHGYIFAPNLEVYLSRGLGFMQNTATRVNGAILTRQLITYVGLGSQSSPGSIHIIGNMECPPEWRLVKD